MESNETMINLSKNHTKGKLSQDVSTIFEIYGLLSKKRWDVWHPYAGRGSETLEFLDVRERSWWWEAYFEVFSMRWDQSHKGKKLCI